MAIDLKEFVNNIEVGIKADKNYKRFLIRFKIDNKTKRSIFDYSIQTDWDKRARINKAKLEFQKLKQKQKNTDIDIDIDENVKLDTFINQHFDTSEKSTSYSKDHWIKVKKSHYSRYIKDDLGNKKISSIRQMHIKSNISKLKVLGLSARTQKQTLEILNPMFKSAIANRIITFNPCDGISISRPKTKKKVQQASILLKEIHTAIIKIFEDNNYFKALYLLALQGRRKSEILTLKWENIDFKTNLYTLPQTKNGEEQTFLLPSIVKELLLTLKSNRDYYVFQSPLDETAHIKNIDGQTKKLKKELNNPTFGIHYLRNIVVSAMAEQGVDPTHLSGALGHSDLHTMKKYLSIDYTKGSKVANETIEQLTKIK